MPTPPKRSAEDRARLASLARRPDLVIEGAIRPLTSPVLDEGRYKQPAMALWVEANTGLIRSMRIIVPEDSPAGGIETAIAGLITALSQAGRAVIEWRESLSEPGLPRRILVDDAALADAVRDLLAGLDVEVGLSGVLPALHASYAVLNATLVGEHPAEPPGPFSWDVDLTLLLPLYQMTQAYAMRAPWKYMNDQPPIAVSLGKEGPADGIETLYGCVVGSHGKVEGIAFYYTLADLEHTLDLDDELTQSDEDLDTIIAEMGRIGIAIDRMERDSLYQSARYVAVNRGTKPESAWPGESLVLYFGTIDETDPTYLDWLRAHELPIASDEALPSFWYTGGPADPRRLNAREVCALTAALQAVNGFVDRHQRDLATTLVPVEPLEARVPIDTAKGERRVEVRWPYV